MPNGAGHVPAGEPEPLELVVWDEFLNQRKELSLLKSDVCVKQLPRRIQRLSIDDAGRHADVEFASEAMSLFGGSATEASAGRALQNAHLPRGRRAFSLVPWRSWRTDGDFPCSRSQRIWERRGTRTARRCPSGRCAVRACPPACGA